ncbi:hypothetical protein [Sphaerisporangium rhizosphaerae]|uniref:Uncharacterized protein n=1 Tax=Sphaerisporangium rhizosphaerae TaxID=2269375 RepID=A0ABW2NZL6_9ACTN
MSYWQTRFELGTFSETHLRHGATAIFSARPGRSTRPLRRRLHEPTAEQGSFH